MSQLWHLKMLDQFDNEIDDLLKQKNQLRSPVPIREEIENIHREIEEDEVLKKQLQKEIKKMELEVGQVVAHRESVEKKLYSGYTTNPKELRAWKDEVDFLLKKQEEVEEIILEKMEELESLEAKILILKEKLSQKEVELKEVTETFEKRSAEIEEALKEVRKKREKMASLIDEKFLTRYMQVRKLKQGSAVSVVSNGRCGACYMILSPSTLSKVKSGQLVTCSTCSRILYWEGK